MRRIRLELTNGVILNAVILEYNAPSWISDRTSVTKHELELYLNVESCSSSLCCAEAKPASKTIKDTRQCKQLQVRMLP